jgi:type IX secretion system PorP/SprF family membrane protein
MKQYYTPLYLAILLLSFGLYAQQDPHISLYRFHLNMFNPAVVGSQGETLLGMSFRSQWQSFENAPETQVVSFSTPTKGERVGLGLHIINDKTFVERQTLAFGSFSYRLPLKNNWDLFLGIQAGFNNFRVNAANLSVYTSEGQIITDPNLINHSTLNPNVGVGAFLKNETFYFSLSAPRILNSERFKSLEGLTTTAADKVHFYASGGAVIPLNYQWDFIPSFLFRYVNNAPFLNTFNASFSYTKNIDFGFEYNLQSGFGGTLMVNTLKTLSFGYAYVTSRHSALNQFSKGSHEIALRVRLGQPNQSNSEEEESSGSEVDDRNARKELKIGTRNKERKKGFFNLF